MTPQNDKDRFLQASRIIGKIAIALLGLIFILLLIKKIAASSNEDSSWLKFTDRFMGWITISVLPPLGALLYAFFNSLLKKEQQIFATRAILYFAFCHVSIAILGFWLKLSGALGSARGGLMLFLLITIEVVLAKQIFASEIPWIKVIKFWQSSESKTVNNQ